MRVPYIVLAAAAMALGVGSARSTLATVIYSDSFSQPAAALNGGAPDVRPGSETWQDGNANYSYSGSGDLTIGSSWGKTATLPFTPVAGNVYLVSADITIPDTTSSEWVGIGFFSGTDQDGLFGNGAFVLDRGNGSMQQAFAGNWVEDPASVTGAVQPTNNIGVKLDTTAPLWSATLVVNGVELADTRTTFAANPTLNGVGLITDIAGSADNFELSTVPEPASLGLLGLAGLTLMHRRRTARQGC